MPIAKLLLFTPLEAVESILGFRSPLRLNVSDASLIETLPKQINQHRSFAGSKLNKLLLNGCKAHGEIII